MLPIPLHTGWESALAQLRALRMTLVIATDTEVPTAFNDPSPLTLTPSPTPPSGHSGVHVMETDSCQLRTKPSPLVSTTASKKHQMGTLFAPAS